MVLESLGSFRPLSLPSPSPGDLNYKMAAEGQDDKDGVRGRRKSGALGEMSSQEAESLSFAC